jgi:hypothetical protein
LKSLQGNRRIEMTVNEFTAALAKFARSEVKRYLEKRLIASSYEVDARIKANKTRVENRSDQVDKRAFQKALLAKINEYPTIASAIREQQRKPRFKKRTDITLHKWAREIWPTAPKVGRPKRIH